jgi:hypothetical protein
MIHQTPRSQEPGDRIEVSGVRFQVSVVKSKSLSSIEYPASSIARNDLMTAQFYDAKFDQS